MNITKLGFAATACLVPLLLHSGDASAASFNPYQQWNAGPASHHSAFLFGNLNYSYSDTQSAVFVGGNANLNNFRVGDTAPANLEVRGTLTGDSGYVTGDILAKNASLTNFDQGGALKNTYSAIDLEQSRSYYQNLSSAWAGAAPEGTVTQTSWGEITMTADSGTSVFNLVQNGQIGGTPVVLNNNFNIDMQSDSNIVLNFFGDDWELHNLGFMINGIQVDEYQDANAWMAKHLFFNFPDAEHITLGCIDATGTCGGIGIPGNILAPNATITAVNGQSIGGIVANNFTDGGYSVDNYGRYQINNAPDQPTATPLPASVLLFGSGLASLSAGRRWRKTASNA